jgi:uncharacterized Ntn-hydrolase superfamily protein
VSIRDETLTSSALLPPCHTYSIVARDPATGQIGVAVQSHYFCVGAVVPWAEAGVGAVATQAMADPSYGPRGLELMRAGRSASDALALLLAADQNRAVRQVAMVDRVGNVAAHTGASTIAEAGHITGDSFSVQANMMLHKTVWTAMAEAYRATAGDLANRLVAALDAAEAEGGDIRGRQSAALLVVEPKASGRLVDDRIVDLRVDDAREPLIELRRLLEVSRAYLHLRQAQAALAQGDFLAMNTEFDLAARMSGDNPEIRFWQAVALLRSNHIDEGLKVLTGIVSRDTNWRKLALRLPDFMLEQSNDLLARISKLC